MLQSLRIRNLALLEEITLDLRSRVHAVTGETRRRQEHPAGSAQSGWPVPAPKKTVIRQGAAACEVEAVLFSLTLARSIRCWRRSISRSARTAVLILKRSLARD